jgi:hypothetical protein
MGNSNDSRDRASDDGRDSTKTKGIDGDTPWPLKEPREMLSDRKVRLPSLAEDRIAGEGDAPRVAWNYDTDSGYVFISDTPARKAPYTFADMTKVFDAGGEYPKIRAPSELPAAVRDRFEVPGTFVVYLASEEMLTDENPSTWILSWTQLMRILPNDDQDDEVESLIARNPGFMPPSPF